MPSKKLTRILKAKSPFSTAEIEAMSDSEGWAWIYFSSDSTRKPRKVKLPQVCFTGFSVSEKEELTALANESRLEVVGSVTKNLAFLCVGENAGPMKLEKAKEQGTLMLTRSQFKNLLETGEFPI